MAAFKVKALFCSLTAKDVLISHRNYRQDDQATGTFAFQGIVVMSPVWCSSIWKRKNLWMGDALLVGRGNDDAAPGRSLLEGIRNFLA